MKIAIYTAIFGDKDEIKEPLNFESKFNIDYFIITDNKELLTYNYKLIYKPIKHKNITLNARFYKIYGLPIFDDYDYVIWHDGNFRLKIDKLEDLILKIDNKCYLSTFKHPLRSNYYDEAITCIKLNKDSALKILAQVTFYFLKKLPKEIGLFETGLLIKNNRNKSKHFCDIWWGQIKLFSRRDQIGLIYALWKSDQKISIIDGSGAKNVYSEYFPHCYKHYRVPKTFFTKMNIKKVRSISMKIIEKLK